MELALSKALYRWARNNPDRISQLETMLDESVAALAEGRGQSFQSATANGVSVLVSGSSLSLPAYVATLSHALALLENPPVSVVRARIA